ncbi:hypothetical protein Csa_007979, partial [Cucumis sativus]
MESYNQRRRRCVNGDEPRTNVTVTAQPRGAHERGGRRWWTWVQTLKNGDDRRPNGTVMDNDSK